MKRIVDCRILRQPENVTTLNNNLLASTGTVSLLLLTQKWEESIPLRFKMSLVRILPNSTDSGSEVPRFADEHVQPTPMLGMPGHNRNPRLRQLSLRLILICRRISICSDSLTCAGRSYRCSSLPSLPRYSFLGQFALSQYGASDFAVVSGISSHKSIVRHVVVYPSSRALRLRTASHMPYSNLSAVASAAVYTLRTVAARRW